MDPVCHFEFPCDDPARMTRFYETAFGWRTRQLGEEMGHYVLATSTESDAKGCPVSPGTINGGFYLRQPGVPAAGPSVVIAVQEIGRAMKRVAEAGGRVHGAPMEIPGVGQYVRFADPEGNELSMLQPAPGDCPEAQG